MGGSSDEGRKTKSSFKLGGGVGSGLFSSYLSMKNGNNVTDKDIPLPDSMKTSTLIEQIASERSWRRDLVLNDIDIMEKNRLFTISDLRILSKESWNAIELLPIVKDLLQMKIYKKGKKAKKMKKKMKLDSSCSSEEEPMDSITEGVPNLSLNDSKENGNGISKPRPGTILPSGSKIKVATANGKIYEAARYCPHKGVDLAKGWVSGNNIVCPKHKWEFNLASGGSCSTKPGYSLRACEINDW